MFSWKQRGKTLLLLVIGNYFIILVVRPTWYLIRLYVASEQETSCVEENCSSCLALILKEKKKPKLDHMCEWSFYKLATDMVNTMNLSSPAGIGPNDCHDSL